MNTSFFGLLFNFSFIQLSEYIYAFSICMGKCSYVDVSTVDVETSKLICEHIRATGAHFLEVNISLCHVF